MRTKLKAIGKTSLAACFVLAATSQSALAEANDYYGITAGGDIEASDRIATDDLKTINTKVQISSVGEVVTAGFALDLTIQHSPDKDVGINSSISTLSIKASLPLNSAKDKAPIDFKTFGNDGKFSIAFNNYQTRFAKADGTHADYANLGRICMTQQGNKWIEQLGPSATQSHVDQIQKYDKEYHGLAERGLPVLAILGTLKSSSDFAKASTGACTFSDENEYPRRFLSLAKKEDRFRQWRANNFDKNSTFFWGAEGSLGYNRFSIADRTTLSLRDVDRVGFDASGHVGLILGDAKWVLLLSGGYTRTYKAKALVDLCGPPGPDGKSVCINGQDGEPARKDTGYATASFRKVLISKSSGEPVLGIRPSATYILEDKDWQFELPIYFQRNKAGALDAGVRAVYNTGKDKVAFGAFVGTSF